MLPYNYIEAPNFTLVLYSVHPLTDDSLKQLTIVNCTITIVVLFEFFLTANAASFSATFPVTFVTLTTLKATSTEVGNLVGANGVVCAP